MIADAQAEEMANERRTETATRKETPAKVTVPLDEYVRLNLAAYDLDLLLKTLLNNASRSYSGDSLRFDDEKVDTVVSLIEPEGYFETLSRLPIKEA